MHFHRPGCMIPRWTRVRGREGASGSPLDAEHDRIAYLDSQLIFFQSISRMGPIVVLAISWVTIPAIA
jgi:hypothetical protein